MASVETKTVKKRPGRPSTKQASEPVVNLGIVNTPVDPENVIEVKHTNVTVFTAPFSFFDKINGARIYVNFTPKSMTMFCKNESKPLRCIMVINVSKLHRYYCKDNYWAQMNRTSFSKAFHTSDKTVFDMITISKSKSLGEKLDVNFNDPLLKRKCNHEIELSTFSPDNELFESTELIDPKLYPLTFILPSAVFKKTVVDIEKINDSYSYEYIEGKNTILKITAPRSGYNYNEKFEDGDAINLTSKLKYKDMIDCQIKISNVKPLSSALSSVIKKIKICLSEDGESLFITKFDDDDLVVANVILSTTY